MDLFLLLIKRTSRVLKRKFRNNFKYITKILPGSFKVVSTEFSGCFTKVLKMFPWCFREGLCVIFIRKVSKVFQACFKEVLFCLLPEQKEGLFKHPLF